MTSPYQIEQALSAWQSTRARLLADDPSLEADEAALIELLGPEQGDVEDILARLLRAAKHADIMEKAAKERADEISARAARYKTRSQSLRATAFAIMDAVGLRRVELPDMTASIKAGTPSAVITDEDAIPASYLRVKREPDKAAILAAMKAGQEVPGARWSNGIPSIAIKGK